MNPLEKVPAGVLAKASLLATVGSTAHGVSASTTGPLGDDLDLLGMYVPPRENVYGLREAKPITWRTQPDGTKSGAGDVDLTLHPARKFITLAHNGNPTILAAMFSPEQHIGSVSSQDGLANTPLGYLMEAKLGDHFRSLKAGYSFIGYAASQHQRLLGERGQMKVNRPELVMSHGFDTKYAAHVLRLCHQGEVFMETGSMPMPVWPGAAVEILSVRRGEKTFDEVVEMIFEWRSRLEGAVERAEQRGLPRYPVQSLTDALILNVHESSPEWIK